MRVFGVVDTQRGRPISRPRHAMTKENWALSDQLDGGLSPSAARTTFEAAARFAFEATGLAVATLETTARRT